MTVSPAGPSLRELAAEKSLGYNNSMGSSLVLSLTEAYIKSRESAPIASSPFSQGSWVSSTNPLGTGSPAGAPVDFTEVPESPSPESKIESQPGHSPFRDG